MTLIDVPRLRFPLFRKFDVARDVIERDVSLFHEQIDAARNARFRITELFDDVDRAHVRLFSLDEENGLQIHLFRFPRPHK